MELTDSSRVRWTRREIRLHLFMLFVHFSPSRALALWGITDKNRFFCSCDFCHSHSVKMLRLLCWIKESLLVPRLLSGLIVKTGALQTSLQYLLQEFSVSLRGLLDEVPHGPSLLAWHHHTCLPKCYCHLHDGCSPLYPRSEPSGCRWWAMFITRKASRKDLTRRQGCHQIPKM